MKAAVVEKPGSFVIKDIPRPVINDEQVLVRVEAGSICNATDNHILHGHYEGCHDFYPQILGHEVCGVVEECGSRVEGLKVGERVVLYTNQGAFCEYMTFYPSREAFAIVPPHMPAKVATCCEMFHGAFLSVVYPAQIQPDERVLIIGCGPMGLTTLMCARLYAKSVSAIDLYPSRLTKAREIGADFTYNRGEMTSAEILTKIQEDTGPVDFVIMCISEDRSAELDAFDLGALALRKNGRMSGLLVAAKNIGDNHRINPYLFISKNILFQHIQGTPDISYNEMFQLGVDLVADGKIPMEKLITHEITLDELPMALKLCEDELDDVVKVIVYPR